LIAPPAMDHIKATFAKCKDEKRAALVSYITAGYPTVEETVDILLGLESGGAGMSNFSLLSPQLFFLASAKPIHCYFDF